MFSWYITRSEKNALNHLKQVPLLGGEATTSNTQVRCVLHMTQCKPILSNG